MKTLKGCGVDRSDIETRTIISHMSIVICLMFSFKDIWHKHMYGVIPLQEACEIITLCV